MPEQIRLEIVTPERLVFSEPVEEVLAPGAEGDFGVLPGHCPFLATLRAGALRYRLNGRESEFVIRGGFAEVQGDRVIILADAIEQGGDT